MYMRIYIYIYIIHIYIYKHSQHFVFTCVADQFSQIETIRVSKKNKVDCLEGYLTFFRDTSNSPSATPERRLLSHAF